ncbi:MAG TPA: peptidase M23, partial [Rikenellaceae bacterium]|nr:peptidase M23 [Rikenellaceae bacterium]
GVDKYEFLNGLESDDRLKNTALRLDRLTRQTYVQSKSFDEVTSVSKTAGDM